MNAKLLLDQLTQENVRVFVDGENLRLIYPKGWGTPEKMAKLKPFKSELIALVKARPRTLVWSVEVDRHNITVIDPHFHSPASMQRSMEGQFGADRVGSVRLRKPTP